MPRKVLDSAHQPVNLGHIRTKKGLQAGKIIQQRSEFLTLQSQLFFYSFLAAATPLSLPGTGNVYADIIGRIILHVNNQRPYTVQYLLDLFRYPGGTFSQTFFADRLVTGPC